MAKKKAKSKKKVEPNWNYYYLQRGEIIKIDGFPLEVMVDNVRVRTATKIPHLGSF